MVASMQRMLWLVVAVSVTTILALHMAPCAAAQRDLQAALLVNRDVPATYSHPAVNLYRRFATAMTVTIASKQRSCPLPSYYKQLAWQEGVLEVFPYSNGKPISRDISLCASRFATPTDALRAYVGDLTLVRALLKSSGARKLNMSFIQVPRIGDETIAWQARTTLGRCYWLRFRQSENVVQITGPCGVVNLTTFTHWASVTSARLK